ncbi:MAG: hypothetical protein ACXWUG_22605, partial [Polyangiales bacterium]
EVLGSLGGVASHVERDGSGGQPIGGSGSFGISGSLRFGGEWVEAGVTADAHYVDADRAAFAGVLVGALRLRTKGSTAGFLDLGAGVLRLDTTLVGATTPTVHWWSTLPCGRVALGLFSKGYAPAAFVIDLAAIVAGGARGNVSGPTGGIKPTSDVIAASLHLGIGARFDL